MLLKSGIIVGIGTLLSRISGYIRDIFIASYLGVGIASEAFAIAQKLPNFFRTIFAEGAFSSAFIPIFNSKLIQNKQEANNFANNSLTVLTIILLILVVIIEIFMPSIITILARGFINEPEKLNLTITLSRITFPYIFFISIVTLYSCILNSINKFAIVSVMPVILNLSMILSVNFIPVKFLQHSTSLAIGLFFAGIIQLILIAKFAKKNDITLKLQKPYYDSSIAKLLKNMFPVIIGSGVVQINLWISTIIASNIPGAVSILYYAERLNQFPLAIIGTALGTILLPAFSKKLKQKQFAEANQIQNLSIISAVFFTLPCVVILYNCSDLIISVLFQRNAFMLEDTIKVAKTLAALSIGLPAFTLIKILTPRYFASFDTKTPVYISIFSIIVNAVIAYNFIYEYQYLAIAYAAVIAGWINGLLLLAILIYRKNFLLNMKFIISLIKISGAAIIMYITLLYLKTYLYIALNDESYKKITILFIYLSVSAIIYLIAIIAFKVFDISSIKEKFKKVI
jgi:putative peptidoglycan lipid II flippase